MNRKSKGVGLLPIAMTVSFIRPHRFDGARREALEAGYVRKKADAQCDNKGPSLPTTKLYGGGERRLRSNEFAGDAAELRQWRAVTAIVAD